MHALCASLCLSLSYLTFMSLLVVACFAAGNYRHPIELDDFPKGCYNPLHVLCWSKNFRVSSDSLELISILWRSKQFRVLL